MKGTLLNMGLLAAVAVLPAGAAEVNHSWETLVESVTVGKSVVVKRMDSVQVEGKLLAIGADSITVRWKKKPEVISREDVFRVRYANIRRRNTLIGMAIGAGAGAVLGAATSKYSRDLNALAGAATGGLVLGPITGGVWPIGKPLYEASVGLKKK
jgi:uncharacterized protein YcfJ